MGWHEEALSVYDMAASQEQAELVPALMKKRAAFLREMYKTHSYSEIQSEPDDSALNDVRFVARMETREGQFELKYPYGSHASGGNYGFCCVHIFSELSAI